MKKTIFILGLFFFASVLFSCTKNSIAENISSTPTFQKNSNIKEADVPASVQSSFDRLYPSTNVIGWDLIDGNYLANFKFNGNTMSVLFAATGSLIETSTEILESQLPKSSTDYCAKYYAGKKIKIAAKILDAAGRVFYKIEIDKTILLFDAAGNFIRIIV